MGIVPFGTNAETSLALDCNFFISKSKYAFLTSGKPIIFPLAAIFVFPIPLISRFGKVIFFSFPEIVAFMFKTAFGFLSNGLVFSSVGANNKTSLKPNLLFCKWAIIPNSPMFS